MGNTLFWLWVCIIMVVSLTRATSTNDAIALLLSGYLIFIMPVQVIRGLVRRYRKPRPKPKLDALGQPAADYEDAKEVQ